MNRACQHLQDGGIENPSSRAKGAQGSKVKKKKKAELEQVANTKGDQGQLMQQLQVPIILEEYMLGEWLRIVEEEDEEEEVIYSCRMVIVDIMFQEHNVKITQDNRTKSNTIISTYRQAEDQARVTFEIWLLD